MKKLLLIASLSLISLFSSAGTIGDDYFTIFHDSRVNDFEIIDAHHNLIKVKDCSMTITYEFDEKQICVSIIYEIEQGFYRNNVLRVNRLNDMPYEKIEFLFNNPNSIIEEYLLPYSRVKNEVYTN